MESNCHCLPLACKCRGSSAGHSGLAKRLEYPVSPKCGKPIAIICRCPFFTLVNNSLVVSYNPLLPTYLLLLTAERLTPSGKSATAGETNSRITSLTRNSNPSYPNQLAQAVNQPPPRYIARLPHSARQVWFSSASHEISFSISYPFSLLL